MRIAEYYGREFSNFEVFISTVLNKFQVKIIDQEEFKVLAKGESLIFKKSKIFQNIKFPGLFNAEMVNMDEYDKMIAMITSFDQGLQQSKQEHSRYEQEYQQQQQQQAEQYPERQPLSIPTNLPNSPFVGVGRADLDPMGSMAGSAGGMIVGPEHPMFTGRNPGGNSIMPVGPGFMPGIGPFNPGAFQGNPNNPSLSGYMPEFPSHPPGARFDPVSPFDPNPSFPNRPVGRGQGRGQGRGGGGFG
jgi:hypothetical protein